jgi:ankyrin repeat protein
VRALLDLGADVNEATTLTPAGGRQMFVTRSRGASGPTALVLAVANAHFELAAMLLDRGANPNAAPNGWTALHEITWVRKPGFGGNQPAPDGSGTMTSLEFVNKLVAKGANINARMTRKADMQSTNLNCVDATPFLLASWTRDVELMRLLAKLGADPLLANADYTTPLLAAAGVGTYSPGDDPGTDADVIEAVKLALELGNNVNAIDDNDETAMHGAAYRAIPAVVRVLAEHGARPDVWNQKNDYGWTPLMIAQGVRRQNNVHSSPETAAVIRDLLGLR